MKNRRETHAVDVGGKRERAHVRTKGGLLVKKVQEKPVYALFRPNNDHMERINVYFSRIA